MALPKGVSVASEVHTQRHQITEDVRRRFYSVPHKNGIVDTAPLLQDVRGMHGRAVSGFGVPKSNVNALQPTRSSPPMPTTNTRTPARLA